VLKWTVKNCDELIPCFVGELNDKPIRMEIVGATGVHTN